MKEWHVPLRVVVNCTACVEADTREEAERRQSPPPGESRKTRECHDLRAALEAMTRDRDHLSRTLAHHVCPDADDVRAGLDGQEALNVLLRAEREGHARALREAWCAAWIAARTDAEHEAAFAVFLAARSTGASR